jgi:hypothetical protein
MLKSFSAGVSCSLAVFVACRGKLGKDRNIPSGEMVVLVVPALSRDDEVGRYGFAFPRRICARGSLEISLPSIRGRREYRVRAAPAVSCAKVQKRNAHEHTGSAEAIRHSLRNGFTAYSALSLVIGLV